MLDGEALHEILRSHARKLGEQALEVGRAQPRGRSEVFQARLLVKALVEVADHPGHALVIVHPAVLSHDDDPAHPILAINRVLKKCRGPCRQGPLEKDV